MLQESTSELVDQAASNPVVSGFGQFVSNVGHGDFGPHTWLLFWSSVGKPVLLAIVLIFAVFLAAGWVSKITGKAVRKAKVEETLARFLTMLTRYLVLIAGGVAILGTLGVETTSFAAVLAAVGFAIGMAMSGMLGNIASGIMLLIFRPFKVGDVVDAAGVKGKVYEVGLFTTAFDTFDNRRIIVPNNEIFGGNIENVSHHATRRVDVTVGTEYRADIDRTREVLMAAARATGNILNEPEPVVYLNQLGGSSIDWAVRVWVNAGDYWAVKEKLTRDVKYALDEAEIGIPFPQMDIHIDGGIRRD